MRDYKPQHEYLRKQSSMQTQFTRHVGFCKKMPANTSIHELNERLKNITSLYEEFRVLQGEIEFECGVELIEHEYTLRSQIEDYYYYAVSTLRGQIDRLKLAQQPNQSNPNNNADDIKLPRIEIPIFYGDYRAWPEFKDLFESLIHDNPSLRNVQKFHHLKNKVKGTAGSLIKSLHMTDANYPEAFHC